MENIKIQCNYRVNYISTTLNNLSYNVLFNSDKNIFKVFEIEA